VPGERAVNLQRELAGSGGDGLGFADADRQAAVEGTKCARGATETQALRLKAMENRSHATRHHPRQQWS